MWTEPRLPSFFTTLCILFLLAFYFALLVYLFRPVYLLYVLFLHNFLLSIFFLFLSLSVLSKTQTDIACPECTCTLLVLSFATDKDVQCTPEVMFCNPCRLPDFVTWFLLWFPSLFLPVCSSLSFSYIIPRHITLSLQTSLLSIQLRKCGLFLIT